MLEQDPTSVMVDVMIFFTNNVANGSHTPYIPTDFQPQRTDIIINCLFYASLSASLVAALASVVALQWVANYDAAITRGGSSPEDRAARRQFRHAGVVSWKMSETIYALPILLYFSVILFFAGLILWMWTLNQIVGAVVAAGAALAVMFYGTSTFLAVVFVSAPFRTPLSGWIYSLSHLPFSLLYRLLQAMNISKIPTWLEHQHAVFAYTYKREDLAVKSRVELGRDALIWLANQLSISQDSYKRLLLLAKELPSLEHLPSFTPTEAAWDSIFDLLGWKYLSPTVVDDFSAENVEGMAILQRCCRVPAIQHLVSPPPQIAYINSLEDVNYWSQYCFAGNGNSWTPSNRHPNRLFLLLRDTPRSPNNSKLETELIMRIAHWRNEEVKVPQIWAEVFTQERLLNSDFFNFCVTTFSNFCRLQNWYKWGKEYPPMYLLVICEVIEIASRRNDLVAQSVESLIQAYEALQIGYGNPNLSGSPTSRLARTFQFGKAIQQALTGAEAHELLPLLLARQINSYTSPERVIRLQELVALLWLRISNPVPRDWDYLMQRSMTSPTDITTNWITQVDRLPGINEILRNLATAQSNTPDIGPLWRTTISQEINDPHFVQALETFDAIIQQGCTPADHLAMISLICQDLELDPRPDFTDYFNPQRLASLSRLNDPCLRVLADCARGVNFMTPVPVSEADSTQRRDSWDRVERFLFRQYPNTTLSPVLQLQASLWPMFYGQKELYKRALEEPTCFVSYTFDFIVHANSRQEHLRSVFRFPVACAGCLDGPGHLLFHILDVTFPRSYLPSKIALVPSPAVTSSITRTSGLQMILYTGSAESSLRLDEFFERADKTSLQFLDEMLRSASHSQYQILAMAWNATSTLLQKATGHPAEVEVIIQAIRRALDLPYQPESTSIFSPLSSRMLEVRELCLNEGKGSYIQRDRVSREATEISRLLLNHLRSR